MRFHYVLQRVLRGRLCLLSACLLFVGSLLPAQPVQVKDIFPVLRRPNASVNLNGTLYFAATSGPTGTELWKSDATGLNQQLVKDIVPGTGSSNPARFITVNGVLYFATNTALYRSTGTAAGTTVVRSFFASPTNLTNVNGTIFFTVAGGSKGFQLWRSNGTATGTILLREYGPGAPSSLANLNGTLYFAANDGTRGTELWKSNGTVAGTTLVKDIFPGSSTDPTFPGPNSSEPTDITAFNGRIYFSANNGVNGRELWRSDGTAAGTVLVKDLLDSPENPGSVVGSAPKLFRVVNNSLYFVATKELQGVERIYRTDGTADGTVEVGGAVQGGFGQPAMVTAVENVNGTLYYATVTNNNFTGFSSQLRKITAGVDAVVRSYEQGPGENFNGVGNLVNVNGTLFYSAFSPTSGTELWKVDPLQGTATRLTELVTGPGSTLPYDVFNIGNVLYFRSRARATTDLFKFDLNRPQATAIRINAGGPAHTVVEPYFPENDAFTYPTETFGADAFFTGGSLTTLAEEFDNQVVNVFDPKLYFTERWGPCSYNIPVPQGRYQVVLHFAEIYFGFRTGGGIGSRKFNVNLEGTRRLTEYDIFAKAGGARRLVKETLEVNVTDGTLNIAFLKGSASNPAISAIEVVPLPTPVGPQPYRAINLNGAPVVLDGNAWQGKTAANYNTNGGTFTNTTVALIPATDPVRESMIRSSIWRSTNLQLNLTAVPSGTYQVFLYVWEDNTPQTFSITLEGRVVQSNYNSGAAGSWKKLGPFQAAITDGTINIATTGGAVNFSGVEVWKVNASTTIAAREALAVEAAAAETFAVKLYPNPVQDRLSVKLPFAADQVRGTSVADASGKPRLHNAHQAVAADELEIRTEDLQPGFYLLKLDTEHGFKVVKFIKQ